MSISAFVKTPTIEDVAKAVERSCKNASEYADMIGGCRANITREAAKQKYDDITATATFIHKNETQVANKVAEVPVKDAAERIESSHNLDKFTISEPNVTGLESSIAAASNFVPENESDGKQAEHGPIVMANRQAGKDVSKEASIS